MSQSKTTVLITGGNNGIGLATCQLFASRPNYHIIMASRSLEKGQKAISSIQPTLAPSSTISLVQLDVLSDESIKACVEQVASITSTSETTANSGNQGKLDILINNAGICPTEFSRDILRSTLETNAISPALVTQAFTPLLLNSHKSNNTPRIIYVSSVLGSITTRGDPKDVAYGESYKAYRISKTALNMLVACDAWEFGEKMTGGKGKVFAFCPGYVVTDLAGQREEKMKGGIAKDARTSAEGIVRIAEGKRDTESGLFVFGDEVGQVYAW